MNDPYPITIGSDALTATILPRGAALVGVRFAGQSRNLVISFADPADHINVPICAGSLVGPIANRVRDGQVHLDGQTYQMPINENTNCLHSGPEGLHSLLWQVDARASDSVTLTCTLADGANGLPGNRHITATYSIDRNVLTLAISATTDKTTAMNIASHPYWNLDGGKDVSGHQLTIQAKHYVPVDAQGLPTGDVRAVVQSAFDFTSEKNVPLIPELDINFCLAGTTSDTPSHLAILRGIDGTQLDIATTAPGLQVYNGSSLPNLPVAMANCPPLKPYSGIALEPQHWPDAPHHADFHQITLEPDETYSQTTHFTLTKP